MWIMQLYGEIISFKILNKNERKLVQESEYFYSFVPSFACDMKLHPLL